MPIANAIARQQVITSAHSVFHFVYRFKSIISTVWNMLYTSAIAMHISDSISNPIFMFRYFIIYMYI